MQVRVSIILIIPMLLFAVMGVKELLAADSMTDLFIYRAGARLGWQGESPYTPKIADAVAVQWPEKTELHANCGFFLTPQAVLIAGPFAAIPWPAAKVLYTLFTLVALVACWYIVAIVFRTPPRSGWPPLTTTPWALAWLVTLHLVTIMAFTAGQTTIFVATAILLGQLSHERGRVWLGGFLWSLAFVKPHIALPLLPLAIILSGWRRGAILIVWLAILNAFACMMIAGSPLFIFDYLNYLQESHKGVIFNRIDWNVQITSWNRIAHSVGIHPIELNMKLTVLGYGVVAAIAGLRSAFSREKPSNAWYAAVAVACAVCCCQVLPYELFLLVLVIPFILECRADGRRGYAAIIIAILVAQMIPMNQLIYDLGLGAYRAVLTAALLVAILAAPWQGGVSADKKITDSS